MNNFVTIGPSRLRSWQFWKDKFKTYPQAFDGFQIGESYTQFLHTFKDGCPFCNGYMQAVDPDSGKVYYCICSMTSWLEDKHQFLAGIETYVQPAKLNELRPLDKYQGSKTLREVKKQLAEWIPNPTNWFFITGKPGTGKTHILRALKSNFGTIAFYVSSEDFNSAIFAALARKEKGMDLERFVTEVSTVPILLFDDYGIEHTNSMHTDVLAQVINRRYNAGPTEYPVVMTTNLSVADMVGSPDIGVARIASRLVDENSSKVYELLQPDYRLATTKKD
jgi:DNA replication protein DnaC